MPSPQQRAVAGAVAELHTAARSLLVETRGLKLHLPPAILTVIQCSEALQAALADHQRHQRERARRAPAGRTIRPAPSIGRKPRRRTRSLLLDAGERELLRVTRQRARCSSRPTRPSSSQEPAP